jgi:hypothetical protein
MRSFRFPLWAIVLMLTSLIWTVVAIEKVRMLSVQLASAAGSNGVASAWWALPGLFMMVAVVLCCIGLAGYGLLHLLRRTGVQRISSVEIGHRVK